MTKKIMVIDDSSEITFSVKFGLEKINSDLNVTRVESGEKFFEMLEKNEIPDLILLDIMMPKMNGWQVFKKLRKNDKWRNIPVFFLTAKSDNFSKAFGKIIAESYIEKPFEINDLNNRIEKMLIEPYTISETKAKILDDMLEHVQ